MSKISNNDNNDEKSDDGNEDDNKNDNNDALDDDADNLLKRNVWWISTCTFNRLFPSFNTFFK